MDKQIKEFINHLYSIGIVSQQNFTEILGIYNKYKVLNNENNSFGNSISSFKTPISNRSNEINHTLKDIMQTILYEFIIKQDEISFQNMSFDVVSKYTEQNFIQKTKMAKKHFMYYLRHKTQKMTYYFIKWRQNLKKKWKIPEKVGISSEMKKEQDSLMSCTFKPQINNTSKSLIKYNSIDPFNRLYSDYERKQTKRNLQREAIDKKESELLKTIPNITNPNHSYYMKEELATKTFLDRQQDYNNMSVKKKEKIQKENEELESMLFTYTPSINNTAKVDCPAHVRLYS